MAKYRYGPGIIEETQRGTYAASVSLGHQQRARRILKTLADAKAWVLSTAANAAPLDPATASDAQQARAILPDTTTLTEAARFWIDNHPTARLSTTLAHAWDKYTAAVNDGKITLRSRTLGSYRQAWRRLTAATSPETPISAIDAATIDRLATATASPIQRNGLIRALSAVFGFLVEEGFALVNPCASVRRARVSHSVPAILTVEETKTALALAVRDYPTAVPALALGLFAGLRPQEIFRIRPANVANGFLSLSPAETKTAESRNVRIAPNLAAWLSLYPIPKTGISARAIKKFRAAWRKRGGAWPQDCARHSYASYAYEMTKNAAAVAADLGHVGTDVFFRHYRALAAPDSGTRYFAIMPPKTKKPPR